MRLRAIPSLLCIVSMAASGGTPRPEVAPVSYGILEPESAASLMAAAQRAVGNKKIDMSRFSYSGSSERFPKLEHAWMTTERVRQPDGSDLWTDIICSTYSRGYGPWQCISDEERTVAVEVNGVKRILEFNLPDGMSGDRARQIISLALSEVFRTQEMEDCDSKIQFPVPEDLVSSNDWRGADGSLAQDRDVFQLSLDFVRIRFSFDETASLQVRRICIIPPDELE